MKTNYFIVSNARFDVHLSEDSVLKNHWQANWYVSIPKCHPLYGKDYNEVDDILWKDSQFAVHWGLTFGTHLSKCWPEIQTAYLNSNDRNELTDDVYVYWFDTMHAGDTKEFWTTTAVRNEAYNLKQAFVKYLLTMDLFDECGEE